MYLGIHISMHMHATTISEKGGHAFEVNKKKPMEDLEGENGKEKGYI